MRLRTSILSIMPAQLRLRTLGILAVLLFSMTGCGEDESPIDARDITRQAEDILPPAGPKFCHVTRPAAPTACLTDTGCLELLPDADVNVAQLEAECADDGGRIVEHCAKSAEPIIGACVEDDRLRVQFDSHDEWRESCNLDGYEWVSCPSSNS